jgi:hypothetical protein
LPTLPKTFDLFSTSLSYKIVHSRTHYLLYIKTMKLHMSKIC